MRLKLVRGLCWLLPEGSFTTLRAALYRSVAGIPLAAQVSCMSPLQLTGRGRGWHRRLRIGARSYIGEHAVFSLNDDITIGSDVCLSPYVKILSGEQAEPGVGGAVRIGDGAWIGVGAMILPGTDIGRGSVVGAGSVVQGQVPPDTLVSGVPAREIRKLD